MLLLMAQELKNPWEDAAVNPAPSVLALFQDNPFGPFDEMFLEQRLEWEPYDRAKLLEDLKNKPGSSFDVHGRKPHYFEGSIARHRTANTVNFKINPDYLATPNGIDRTLAYLGR